MVDTVRAPFGYPVHVAFGAGRRASRTKRSSSDSRRGETDSTLAPAASAARRKPSTSAPSGRSSRRPSLPACSCVPGGNASAAPAGGRSTTSVDSRRADSSAPSGPTLRMLAADDDGHAIADHLDVGEDVGREEDGAALGVQLDDQVAHLLAADGIEPGHRFVEDDQLRIAHQRLRDPDPLQHALGELAQGPAARVVEADARDQAIGAAASLRRRHVAQRADEIQELFRREVIVEVGALGQVADPALGRQARHRQPQHLGAPAGREDEAHQHLEGGGLAGAVGAQEPEDLAAMDVEADVFHRLDALAEEAQAEGLGQSDGSEDHLGIRDLLADRGHFVAATMGCVPERRRPRRSRSAASARSRWSRRTERRCRSCA